MNVKKALRVFAALFICITAVFIAVYASDEEDEEKKYSLFYMNGSETKLGEDEFKPEKGSLNYILQTIIDTYNTGHRNGIARYLPNNLNIDSWSMEDGTLTLNLSEEYFELSTPQTVLLRAAFARTFTQFSEVLFVLCKVDGEEIKDENGNPVGRMSSVTFVEVNSSDRDSYRYDSFTLYFTDQDGKRLIPEIRRVYYRRSLPKARVALEQLANGPMEKGNYPTISSDVTLESIVISDGICYADFDRSFLDEPVAGVSPEITVWSVAHTIIANTEAEKAEIMVDGMSDETMGELDLYQFFGWNDQLSAMPE